MLRILQFCFHKTDNLGDTISHDVLLAALARLGIEAEVEAIDMLGLSRSGKSLDERLEDINRTYDCIVLGSGGLLNPYLLKSIFSDTSNWLRLTPPLVLFGIGIISNEGSRIVYNLMSANDISSPTVAVLKAASVVAIRDLRTQFLAQRVRGSEERIFMTGCPSIQFVRKSEQAGRKFLVNLPLNHGPTRNKAPILAGIGHAIVAKMDETLWLCHSKAEEQQARNICKDLEDRVEIVRPNSLDEISAVIQSSTMGIVVKAHPAIFMLANLKPFAFISYDMKCSALLEMICDDPNMFMVPLARLDESTAGPELTRLVRNLSQNERPLNQSMKILREHLDKEYVAFETAFRGVLGLK